MIPVYSSQIGVQYRRPPLGKLAVEYDDRAVHHELLDSLGVAEEVILDCVLRAEIYGSGDMPTLVFVVKSAINYYKIMLVC